MFKSLSRSVSIMFLFDLLILAMSAAFWCKNYALSFQTKITAVILICLTGLIVLFLKGNYKIREFNITFWNAYRLFEGVVFANIPAAVLLCFYVSGKTLLEFSVFNILTVFSGLYIYRLGFHCYLFNLKKIKKVLIIGANDRAKAAAELIKNKQALKMEVIKILENETDINKTIEETNADIVIFTYKPHVFAAAAYNVKYYLMPEFYEMAAEKFYIDDDTIDEFAYDVHKKYSESVYDELKRIFDIISALIILIVTLPITSYIALRVWLTDKHSPFFTQTRIGKDGKKFECYKLRTMYVNDYVPKAGKINEDTAEINDDRVIPFCKWVRKARFDELPQMINILKGDMSIVGPRAEWEDLVNIYKNEIPYYTCRQWIKTGWTGWAQINQGHCVSNEDIAEKLQYDLYYLKNRNILWDISILVKAVFMALGGRHK